MITKSERSESVSDFFNEITTKQFLEELDHALRSVKLKTIKKVFKDYGVYHLESCQDFMGQLHYEFNSLKKEGVEIMFIDNAKPRLSKCIGCSFGSTIKAFKYQYKQRHWHGLGKRDYYDVVYEKEFGVVFKVKNNILMDLGVCNAFLTKNECDQLKECS